MTLSDLNNSAVVYVNQNHNVLMVGGVTATYQGREYRIFARRYDLSSGNAMPFDPNHSWTRDLPTIMKLGSEILLNRSGVRPEDALFDFTPGAVDRGYIVNNQTRQRLDAETIALSAVEKATIGERMHTGLDVLREMDGAISPRKTVVAGTTHRCTFQFQDFALPQAFQPKPSALPAAVVPVGPPSSAPSAPPQAAMAAPSAPSPASLSVVNSPVPFVAATTAAPSAPSPARLSVVNSPVPVVAAMTAAPSAPSPARLSVGSSSIPVVLAMTDSASASGSPVAANKARPAVDVPKTAASEDMDDWFVDVLNSIPLQFDGKKVHYNKVAKDDRAVQAFKNLLENPNHPGKDETAFREWLYILVGISCEFYQNSNLEKAYSTGGERWGWSKEQYLRWLSIRVVLWYAGLSDDSNTLVDHILKV